MAFLPGQIEGPAAAVADDPLGLALEWICYPPGDGCRLQSGAPSWMVLADVPAYALGLPASWVGSEEGNQVTFESQASYLRRHNLLTPHELRVLSAGDYEQTETLPEGREVLEGPYSGPNAEGVRWLNEWEAAIRARIPEARKAMGFFDYQQARPN